MLIIPSLIIYILLFILYRAWWLVQCGSVQDAQGGWANFLFKLPGNQTCECLMWLQQFRVNFGRWLLTFNPGGGFPIRGWTW